MSEEVTIEAVRMARNRGPTRDDIDGIGVAAQQKAARAWDANRFVREVIPVEAPAPGDDGKPTGTIVERI